MTVLSALDLALGYLRREAALLQFDADLHDTHGLETQATRTASQMRREVLTAIDLLELLKKAMITLEASNVFRVA